MIEQPSLMVVFLINALKYGSIIIWGLSTIIIGILSFTVKEVFKENDRNQLQMLVFKVLLTVGLNASGVGGMVLYCILNFDFLPVW